MRTHSLLHRALSILAVGWVVMISRAEDDLQDFLVTISRVEGTWDNAHCELPAVKQIIKSGVESCLALTDTFKQYKNDIVIADKTTERNLRRRFEEDVLEPIHRRLPTCSGCYPLDHPCCSSSYTNNVCAGSGCSTCTCNRRRKLALSEEDKEKMKSDKDKISAKCTSVFQNDIVKRLDDDFPDLAKTCLGKKKDGGAGLTVTAQVWWNGENAN